MNRLHFVQIEKDNAEHFEISKKLWIPFIYEMVEHEGTSRSEEEILDGLSKRIAIQGMRPDMHFEIVMLEEKAIGISMFAIDKGTVYGLLEAGYGTIIGFYIQPQDRNKGFGREFFLHIEEILRRDGATKIYLTPDSVTGLPFWSALGFIDSGKFDPDEKKPIYIKEVRK